MTSGTHTIQITWTHDGQAHHITHDNRTIGQHTGHYQALCGYLASATAPRH